MKDVVGFYKYLRKEVRIAQHLLASPCIHLAQTVKTLHFMTLAQLFKQSGHSHI